MTARVAEALDLAAVRRKLMANMISSSNCWIWRHSTKGSPGLRLAGRGIAAMHVIRCVVRRIAASHAIDRFQTQQRRTL
jgi:hypothetical protein